MPRRKVLKDVEHGTANSYKKGCRCFACTKAASDATRKSRGGSVKIDPLPDPQPFRAS